MTNIQAIQDRLQAHGLDAILLISPVNRRYATGFHSSDGAVLVSRRGACFITDSRYIEAARAAVTGAEVSLSDRAHPMDGQLLALVRDLGIRTLGAEEDSLPHGAWLRWEQRLGCSLVPAQQLLWELRAVKTPEEAAAIRAATRIAEEAFRRTLTRVRPGVTERELAAELTYQMLLGGGEGNSFPPFVVTGKKSSMPHGEPGDVAVQVGDFITMDFGCIKDGYCSDITRTVAVGHATGEMERVYHTVLAAQEAGIAAARAGVSGAAIDAAARNVIDAAGYGAYFGHSFGHGLGLEVHEEPCAAPGRDRPMPAGAVISAEPGIYLPGTFGVRIEDTLYLTETGCENLVSAPKNLIVL